jgi:hypothetical protein
MNCIGSVWLTGATITGGFIFLSNIAHGHHLNKITNNAYGTRREIYTTSIIKSIFYGCGWPLLYLSLVIDKIDKSPYEECNLYVKERRPNIIGPTGYMVRERITSNFNKICIIDLLSFCIK